MVSRATLLALFLVASPLALVGCATPTFDIGTADRTVMPREVASDPQRMRDRMVAWGGAIVATKNLRNETEIEVLGYPLDDSNRPKRDAEPLGRFLAIQPGYLESADYAPGRSITVVGRVSGTRTGTVGQAPYVYPVLATSQVNLWPKAETAPSRPNVYFGIGIGIHN